MSNNQKSKKSKKLSDNFNYSTNKQLINSLEKSLTDPTAFSVNKKSKKRVLPVYLAINPSTNKQIVARSDKELQKLLKTNKNIKKSIQNIDKVKDFNILYFSTSKKFKNFQDKYVDNDNKYLQSSDNIFKKTSTKENKKFKTIITKYDLDMEEVIASNADIDTILSNGLSNLVKDLNDNDKVRVILTNSSGGASTAYMFVKDFKDTYFNNENGVYQFNFEDLINESNSEFQLDDDTQVSIAVSKNPGFSGGRGTTINNKRDMFSKKSILKINNNDDLCLGRCIVCELSDRDNHPQKKQIRMGRKIQTELTHKLYEEAGVDKSISTLESIKQFEKHLDISITIIDGDQYNNVIYPDINSEDYEVKSTNIYLYKTQNHYDLINSKKIAGFFGKSNFCDKCKKTYTTNNHKCKYKCNICSSYECDSCDIDFKKLKYEDWKNCGDCCRNFPSLICFNNHITPNKSGDSMCDKVWKCQDCKKILSKKDFPMETHKCGDFYCGNCKQVVDKDHKCYMFPKKINPHSDKYVYFDFECDIVSSNEHIPNFCVAQYHTSPNNYIFNTCEEFCEWVFNEKHDNYTFIAHNGRGYDFQLIMRWIYKHTTFKPFTIYAGSKIMTFSVSGQYDIRFVDSLNFLTMRLEDMPSTFGFKELKKGFYPYWFNSSENWNYVGELPDKRFYKPNSMSVGKRKEFNEWYDKLKSEGFVYNHAIETRDYCISDVDILKQSCVLFRQLYIDIADIDPFTYTTIASVCMAIFKGYYIVEDYHTKYKELEESLIGLEPSDIKLIKEDFMNEIREQVFSEKKIAIFNYKDTEFIRKSFFGGRTNATKLKYTFKDTEEGKYADITSLYPSVNFYDEYPLGHPEIIEDNFNYDISNYFGFIDCYVECPTDLYFPVLANKGKKLFFDLNNKRGVWATNELQKAVEKGYVIKEIYKVYHFKNKSTELFKPYISKFLKIKQESSGLPDWITKPNKDNCVSEYELDYILSLSQDQRTDLYIDLYHKNQGIRMDKHKIVKNKGLRAIAKLCLNSLWGKFGQRVNMPKTEIICDNKKYWDIMFNDKYSNQTFYEIDEERIEMNYKLQDEYIKNDFNTNIAVASFTTSSARLRLYKGLEYLNRQVLYHDTDSIVYVYDPNNPDKNKKMEIGDYLGE